jgi:hypothetical protein
LLLSTCILISFARKGAETQRNLTATGSLVSRLLALVSCFLSLVSRFLALGSCFSLLVSFFLLLSKAQRRKEI